MSVVPGDNRFTIFKYIIIVIGAILGFCIAYYFLGNKITEISFGESKVVLESDSTSHVNKKPSNYIDINSENKYYINVNNVKLRKFPDPKSPIIEELSANTMVYKLQRTNKQDTQKIKTSKGEYRDFVDYWYSIKKEAGNQGWVYGYFISDEKIIFSPLKTGALLEEKKEDLQTRKEKKEDLQTRKEKKEDLQTRKEKKEDSQEVKTNPSTVFKIPKSTTQETNINTISHNYTQNNKSNIAKYKISKGLTNRKVINNINLSYNGPEEGQVIIKACFNKYGNLSGYKVLKNKYNSQSEVLIEIAKKHTEKIKLSKYKKNKDCGEITFIFEKNISNIGYNE